jgi:hypothetical protein
MSERSCVFCDSAITDGTPPEHVIPQWISRLKPKRAFFIHPSDPYRETPEHRGKRIELTADTVCRDCNHHWMSDLETQASPTLKPMIAGHVCGLDVPTQALLARWATKTAMTWDQTYEPEDRVFPRELCRSLMKQPVPPPGTAVFVGRYAGSGDWISMEHNNLYRIAPVDPSNPGPPDAYRSAIRIGQLIADVSVTEDFKPIVSATGGDINRTLIRIWPSVTVTSWPPKLAFGDATWESFINPDLPNTPA